MAKSSNNKNNYLKKDNKNDIRKTTKKSSNTSKKNSSINSKYNRYEKQSSKSNSRSKTTDIEFLDDLDSTKNLDDSFIEGIRKRKVVEQRTEILDVDEINKANLEYKNNIDLTKKVSIFSYLLLIFGAISLCSICFIIVHFCCFDHKKVGGDEKRGGPTVDLMENVTSSGFDFKEALNPTMELEEILKVFNLGPNSKQTS